MQKHRNKQEWFQLITECRRSGLSDHEWCARNDISSSAFYKAVRRLRAAACEIPERSVSFGVCDLTSSVKQDVVPVQIVPEHKELAELEFSCCREALPPMTIRYKDLTIQITNDTSPALIERTIRILGGMA